MLSESANRDWTIRFTLNGFPVEVNTAPIRRLSDVLREDLGMTGTKVGCDAGDCGACTILLDGEQRCSCMMPVAQVEGCRVTTVEGLAQDQRMNALQQSFLVAGAAQCGICTPGMLMAASELLSKHLLPSRKQVQDALGGVLCRCTGYQKIVEAVIDASKSLQPEIPLAGEAVGARMAKVDGHEKLTGKEIYGADSAPHDSLWLRVVRSPHTRASFRIGNLQKVLEKHSGLHILTAADVPGSNGFGIYPHIKDQPVLAENIVRFRGEAVAALIGDRTTLEHFKVEELDIEWVPEKAVRGCEGALSGKHPPVQDAYPDNLLTRGFLAKGNVETGFREADTVAEGIWQTSAVEHCYLEPEAGYARGLGNRLELFVTTQTPYMDQAEVAHVLGIAPEQVRIIPSAVGGGFGGKLDMSVQPLIAVAAWVLKKPVRCVYSRPESLASSTKRHPTHLKAKAGCTLDGRLTAFEFHGDFNTGAYASWGPTVADRVPIHCTGPYLVPHVLGETRSLLTNEPPSGAFRGFGVPQAAIAHESLMDMLAEKIGMDALDFRIRNALRKGGRTASGQKLQHSVGQVECLEALRPDWVEWRKQADEFNAQSSVLKRGVGIGSVWYGCGNTSMSNPSTIRVGINSAGRVTLYNGAMDIGQGVNTILTQICADALGIPADRIGFIMGDTDLTADAGKTSASRQAFVSGKAAQFAAADLRGKILSPVKAADNARISLEPGRIVIDDSMSEKVLLLSDYPTDENGNVFLGEGTFDPPTSGLDQNGQGTPYATYGFGAQIAEVEVDTKLGLTRVLRLTAAHDVGKAINPTQVEGQIQGGVAQGIGMALMEEYVQGVTENLHDYLIPTVGDMPLMKILLIEDPEPLGPYGAKGIGEHALIPTTPAILGAIHHAAGIRITHIPATPDRVLAALNCAK